jgi:hypothetical protein
MNKRINMGWLAGLATACLLAAPGAHAGAPASEAQWIAAARQAVEYAQQRGMPISLQIDSGDGLPGHTPVGLSSENGHCTLIVSARDNPTADKVSAMIEPAVLELFLAGAAMHEVGHCHRRLNGYPHNEQLLPIVAWMGPVKAWFNRRVLTEEAYADMTEVAWLARHHPQQFGVVVQQIAKVRTRFREPRHDTLPWLNIALAEGPADSDDDLFRVADKRLSRYH